MELTVTAVGLVILAIVFALVRWGQKDDKGYDKGHKDPGYKDPGHKDPGHKG